MGARMRQGLGIIFLVVACATGIGAPSMDALAHRVESFDACGSPNHRLEPCRHRLTVLAGNPVFLRGEARPRHVGHTVRVLRSDPGSSDWILQGTTQVHAWGGMRWNWDTTSDDADELRSYEFVFAIRGHGRSHLVRVWVSGGDF